MILNDLTNNGVFKANRGSLWIECTNSCSYGSDTFIQINQAHVTNLAWWVVKGYVKHNIEEFIKAIIILIKAVFLAQFCCCLFRKAL